MSLLNFIKIYKFLLKIYILHIDIDLDRRSAMAVFHSSLISNSSLPSPLQSANSSPQWMAITSAAMPIAQQMYFKILSASRLHV